MHQQHLTAKISELTARVGQTKEVCVVSLGVSAVRCR
jgi:hypothetical protein